MKKILAFHVFNNTKAYSYRNVNKSNKTKTILYFSIMDLQVDLI